VPFEAFPNPAAPLRTGYVKHLAPRLGLTVIFIPGPDPVRLRSGQALHCVQDDKQTKVLASQPYQLILQTSSARPFAVATTL